MMNDRLGPQSSHVMESVELSTFNDHNGHRNQNVNGASTSSWHPKLTLYRLLVLVATVGLGGAKATTSYLSLNNASITLEWVLGVVVFLFFHLLGSYEELDTPQLRWFFHVDYIEYIWNLLAIFDVDRPFYRSDEFNDTHLRPRHPPITGYRVLVTTLVLFFGMLKSAFWYGNQQNEVTTVECVFGIGVVTCLYWLGLYETSSTKIYPLLFHVDYSDKISYSLGVCSAIGKIMLYLLALTICGGVTGILYYLSSLFLNFQWATSMLTPFPIVGYTTSATIAGLMLTMFLSSVGWCLVLVYMLLRMFVRSPVGRYLSRLAGPRYVSSLLRSTYQDYWLPPTSRQYRRPSFYVKRVLIRQLIKLPVRILFLYIISLLVLIILWLALSIATWGAMLFESLIPVTFTFPFLSFILISLVLWGSSIFLEDIRKGFHNFLAEIHHDYRDEGPSIPLTTNSSN